MLYIHYSYGQLDMILTPNCQDLIYKIKHPDLSQDNVVSRFIIMTTQVCISKHLNEEKLYHKLKKNMNYDIRFTLYLNSD